MRNTTKAKVRAVSAADEWLEFKFGSGYVNMLADDISLDLLVKGIPKKELRFDLRNPSGGILVGCQIMNNLEYHSVSDGMGGHESGSENVLYAVTSDGWAVNIEQRPLPNGKMGTHSHGGRVEIRIHHGLPKQWRRLYAEQLEDIRSRVRQLETEIKAIKGNSQDKAFRRHELESQIRAIRNPR